MFNKLWWIYRNSKSTDSNFVLTFIKSAYIKLVYGKYIFMHRNVFLKGVKNISIGKTLHIGTVRHELNHQKDPTKLNIQGKLHIDSDFYHIGRGCRIDVAEDKVLKIGKGGFINPFTVIIVRNGISIGDETYISWNCQILDEDYHQVKYEGKVERVKKIEIGNKVWIGNSVSIYQGTKIADGCVVASNSVVRGIFEKKNCIIGGNPAKIIRENIVWS